MDGDLFHGWVPGLDSYETFDLPAANTEQDLDVVRRDRAAIGYDLESAALHSGPIRLFKRLHADKDQQDNRGREDSGEEEPATCSKADRRDSADAGRRGQAAYDLTTQQDRTGAQTETIATALATEFHLTIAPDKLLLSDGASGDWYLFRNVPTNLRPQILANLQARLQAFPQVAAVLTAATLSRTAPPRPPVDDWSLVEKARASFDPARSGDLVVLLKPRVISIAKPAAYYTATHGSPWNYDRRVPMLFWYPGAVAHEEPLSVETVDILPTLAALIGLDVPSGEIDGRCIDLDPTSKSTCPLQRKP